MSEKVKDNISTFHDNGLYIPRRTVDIIGEIDEDKFQQVFKNLHSLDLTTGTINVIINSEGGCFRSGMGIYDAIKGCKNHVRAMVYGSCMSMATVILQGADERLASPNSLFMVHYGSSDRGDDNVVNHDRWNEQDLKDRKNMEDIYYEKIKHKKKRFPRNKLQNMLKFDTILNAKEMLEIGLIDKIEEHYE